MADHLEFAVAWDWEHDSDFLSLLAVECERRGISMTLIGEREAAEMAKLIQKGKVTVGAFLDRAAPEEEPFTTLSSVIRRGQSVYFNHPDAVRHAADKATMHLKLLSKGVEVPYTIIISPYSHKTDVELSLTELAKLGRPFIIKPANTTGGGTGVILGAETLKDVIDSRQHHKNDKYLLQEKILPAELLGRRAWYRVFFVSGGIFPCWWDDLTHIYAEAAPGEVESLGLEPLITLTRAIGEVCNLEFFSTEIARTADGRFVVVDYVNEICDMRFQSRHADGVPDATVRAVCVRLAETVALLRQK